MDERSFTICGMSRIDRNEQRMILILQAALQCFLAKGFHQTSMRDIAQAAGVSLGNLYNHFPGKEAIILAVAVAESEELAPLLQRLAASDGERAQVLVFLQDFHALCRQPEWATLAVEVLAESARNPAVAEAFAANRRQLQATLAEALQQVAQRERRRPVLAAALQAQVLLDAIESDALRRGLGEADGTEEASLDLGLLALLLGARA
jgi:AcrR family transcriptional regulator